MKKFFFFSSLILLAACTQHKEVAELQQPDSLLTKQQMVDFLVDVHLLESQVKNLRIPADSSRIVYSFFERDLYDQHGFSDTVYLNSYNYYLDKPSQLKSIYDIVADSLKNKQEAFRAKDAKKN